MRIAGHTAILKGFAALMIVPAPAWGLACAVPVLAQVPAATAPAPLPPRDALVLTPGRRFSAPVSSWMDLRGHNVVMQQQEYSCGAASMATILQFYYGDTVTEEEILKASLGKLSTKEVEDREKNGLSMEDLSRGASELRYAAAVLEVKYEKLVKLPAPVVVRLVEGEFKHFVVFKGEVDGRVFVADPLRGNVRMPRVRFTKAWDGKILAVAKRGAKPREMHPLQAPADWPVTPEEQAARRSLLPAPRVR